MPPQKALYRVLCRQKYVERVTSQKHYTTRPRFFQEENANLTRYKTSLRRDANLPKANRMSLRRIYTKALPLMIYKGFALGDIHGFAGMIYKHFVLDDIPNLASLRFG